jgi:hypothetical protein
MQDEVQREAAKNAAAKAIISKAVADLRQAIELIEDDADEPPQRQPGQPGVAIELHKKELKKTVEELQDDLFSFFPDVLIDPEEEQPGGDNQHQEQVLCQVSEKEDVYIYQKGNSKAFHHKMCAAVANAKKKNAQLFERNWACTEAKRAIEQNFRPCVRGCCASFFAFGLPKVTA